MHKTILTSHIWCAHTCLQENIFTDRKNIFQQLKRFQKATRENSTLKVNWQLKACWKMVKQINQITYLTYQRINRINHN